MLKNQSITPSVILPPGPAYGSSKENKIDHVSEASPYR
jgi:hypothetical protein